MRGERQDWEQQRVTAIVLRKMPGQGQAPPVPYDDEVALRRRRVRAGLAPALASPHTCRKLSPGFVGRCA